MDDKRLHVTIDHSKGHDQTGTALIGIALLLLVIAILIFLFHGDPDVHDLVKAMLKKQGE